MAPSPSRKVTVVGAGGVGSTTALLLLAQGAVDELFLLDVRAGVAQAVALDLAQTTPLLGHPCRVTGGDDLLASNGSDLIIVAAGLPRRPGMKREDLLRDNAQALEGIARMLHPRSPEAVWLVVTNPVDAMAAVVARAGGIPPARVMGMAGVLDGARFRYFLGEAAGVPVGRVEGEVLGGHNDAMVPLQRLATVDGQPVGDRLDPERLQEIRERTRHGGGEILRLYGGLGASRFAPAAATAAMAREILHPTGRALAISAHLGDGLFGGVLARLGPDGVEAVLPLALNQEEEAEVGRSLEQVRRLLDGLAQG